MEKLSNVILTDMENLLLKYMGERLEFSSQKHSLHGPGPVITISRECGCPGNEIAELLTNYLNQKMAREGAVPKWKWVNKEILHKASEALKMNPGDIDAFMKAEESGMVHDLVASFTEVYHVRSAKIKNVIYNVIRNLAWEGHVIIVGRGGGTISWDIPKSLHVYLEAPLSWKSEVIRSQRNIALAEARKLVLERDMQRLKFRENYRTKYNDEIFYDLRFNCKSMSNELIGQLILTAVEQKKMI